MGDTGCRIVAVIMGAGVGGLAGDESELLGRVAPTGFLVI